MVFLVVEAFTDVRGNIPPLGFRGIIMSFGNSVQYLPSPVINRKRLTFTTQLVFFGARTLTQSVVLTNKPQTGCC